MNSSKKGLAIFLSILFLCGVVALFSMGTAMDGMTEAGDKIAVIKIEGTISADDGYAYNQQWLLNTIEEVTNDGNYQGILLYMNTPGGSVYETDQVYLKLKNCQEETNKPIYVSMGPMCASGGYYIASVADEIYANRNALTGSIGIIMGSSIDLTQFLERYGIKVTTITAGANKNMFSFDEPVTEEQKAIMQSVADEAYDQFTQIIAQERQMDINQVVALADGRIYTAKQAKDNGLIDGIADYEETKAIMAQDLQLQDPAFHVFQYEPPFSWWNGLLMQTPLGQAKQEEGLIKQVLMPLISGPAYYYGW